LPGEVCGNGPDDDQKLPHCEEWIVTRYEGPGVFPVEVGRDSRHSQEQQPDRADTRILPPKAPAKLVGVPTVLRRLLFVPGQEIEHATLGEERFLCSRPVRADGVRRGFCGPPVIVSSSAGSHSEQPRALEQQWLTSLFCLCCHDVSRIPATPEIYWQMGRAIFHRSAPYLTISLQSLRMRADEQGPAPVERFGPFDVLLSTLLAEQEGHTSGQIRQLRATIRIALQDRIGMPNKPISLA
jgi:hypothetical protein